MSQYPPDPNQPPPPQDPGQWGAQPPPGPQPPPDPYGQPPGAPPGPYGAPPGVPPGGPPGAPGAPPGWDQQPPSGPGWAQGTPPPMGPAKKGMNPAIPILVVVALVAAGVGAFFLLSGDDSGESPESAVEAMVNAAADQDCGGAIDLFSNASIEEAGVSREELQTQCQAAVESQDGQGLFSQDVELVSTEVTEESDSSATVQATIRSGGEESTVPYQVVQEDGEWRVDFSSFSGGGATPPDDGGTTPPDGDGGSDTTTDTGSDTTTDSGSDSGDSGDSGSGSGSGVVPPDVLAEAENSNEASLAEACGQGDMAACDDLWPITPSGSTIEAWAESCGGREPGGSHAGTCEATYG